MIANASAALSTRITTGPSAADCLSMSALYPLNKRFMPGNARAWARISTTRADWRVREMLEGL
jgi:hypothetical protein